MTALSPLYPSPSESRAKRNGGRGFYKDRGRPYREPRTEERDRRRSPEDREAVVLGRALSELAAQHPRFKESLNRLRHHVLVQVRSPEWKRAAIRKCLGDEPMSPEEIAEETGLDLQSVEETLSKMGSDRVAQQCTRSGTKVVIRKDGKPAEKVFWRRVG